MFVGHCSAVELLADINHFFDTMKLDRDFFLAVGMDGPKVNESMEITLRVTLIFFQNLQKFCKPIQEFVKEL